MMELPPLPPVYIPSPEQWYQRYRIVPGEHRAIDTINAMWLTLLDRMGHEPRPRKFTMPELKMIERLCEKHGADTMDTWREMCDRVTGEPEQAFLRLLSGRGQ